MWWTPCPGDTPATSTHSALQDSCPLERVKIGSGSQVLSSVMVHDTKAISLYSDIDSSAHS